ncbi:MAG: hypothetical protein QG599_175 [Pseudomonadota bacterium]|nr:hypothetical protein [Pseudomonadota bacterium]
MVVDDAPINLKILGVLLHRHGYRVMQFTRGELALRAAAHEPPELILLDIMMPEMDGFEVCRRLKADEALQAIPVIFISALDDTADKVRAFTEGGVDYVAKPFQEQELLARVKTHLSLRRMQRELEKHQRDLEALVDEKVHHLHTVLDAAQAGTWEWNIQTNAIQFDDRWARTLGYQLQELEPTTQATWESRVHPDDLPMMLNAMSQNMDGERERYEAEYRIQHKNGQWVWLRSLGRVMQRTPNGEPLLMVGIDINVTEQKTHQAKLEFVTHHDALTGLPNRGLFAEFLRAMMTICRRSRARLAVAYIDIDGFAAINRIYGRQTGNQLIIELARRIQESVRERRHVARIGGDELAVILSGLERADAFRAPVQRLIEAVSRPIVIDKQNIVMTASIGITLFPQADNVDAEQLLRQADQAMYQVKLAGKNRYHVFDSEHDGSVRERYERIDDIRQALMRQEFVLYYQPKVNLHSGVCIGFEALIRWQHPDRGLLPPGAFLPVLEQHPLLITLGDWVIEAALEQLAGWNADGLKTTVSVNVDGLQLHDPEFAARLERQLQAQPSVTPQQLELEILETGALADMARVSALIEDLQGRGVACALDDFGTGFSSLTFLKRLAAHTVKIDQSFVRNMLTDVEQAVIIDSIVGLTRRFERQVLAEGVETELHGNLLLELGCELGQGYGIARPMSADAVPKWIASWRPPASWRESKAVVYENMPIFFAELQHRAWFDALQNHLDGSECSLLLNFNQCSSKRWLHNIEIIERFGHRADFIALDALHDELHAEAVKFMAWRHAHQPDKIEASLPELQALSNLLLSELKLLRHS